MKILNQNQGLGAIASPLLCIAKRKKGSKEKQKWVSEQKLLKVFHQGQNVTVLAIVRRLEFKNFSCRLITVVDNTFECSMAPPFWNPFRRPWKLVSVVSMNLSRKKEIRSHIKIFMFPIARPSLLKSTDPNFFFRKNLKKIIENLYLFTKKVRDLHLLCHLIWFKFD